MGILLTSIASIVGITVFIGTALQMPMQRGVWCGLLAFFVTIQIVTMNIYWRRTQPLAFLIFLWSLDLIMVLSLIFPTYLTYLECQAVIVLLFGFFCYCWLFIISLLVTGYRMDNLSSTNYSRGRWRRLVLQAYRLFNEHTTVLALNIWDPAIPFPKRQAIFWCMVALLISILRFSH